MWRNVLMLAVLITVACPVPAADPLVVCRQNAESLELFCRDRLVLRYHTAVVEPPAGVDPVFRRSGFMHPVATPSGRVVTDDFPADHLHQHGIFCAWVNTTFEGRSVDFWNQKGRTGNVEHVRVIETHNDGSAAGFTVELQHLDLTAPNGPKTVLQELWTVTCRDAGELHLFDIDSRQACIADSPLLVNEYHYGGMAFRGTSQWFQEGTDFEFRTSEGLGRSDGNHTRPNWVAAIGSIDGQPSGIAMMGHPLNPRHPEPVRLHPSKPYFVFSPSVLGEFRLEPGMEQRRRFRYVAFDGPLNAARIDGVFAEYSKGDVTE